MAAIHFDIKNKPAKNVLELQKRILGLANAFQAYITERNPDSFLVKSNSDPEEEVLRELKLWLEERGIWDFTFLPDGYPIPMEL